MDSFSATYVEARDKFLAAADAAGARLHTYGREDLTGRHGERLACDVAVLGPDDAERAAIAIVGVHGAEAYCGSAILHEWLRAAADKPRSPEMKVVLVHAINPWAFSHMTRGTENNVDLNRNFLPAGAEYRRDNPSYDELIPFLHAGGAAADDALAAYVAYRSYLDRHGWHIEGEAWAGQAHRPDGLFYMGAQPEWANRTFRAIVDEHLGGTGRIGFIDWHTGIGRFGEIVHLVFDGPDTREYALAARWWGLQGGSGGAFGAGTVPAYRGLLCQAIRQELPASQVAGAVVEFGTCDEYTMFRADRLDRWLLFEGRGDRDHDGFREDYRNACCPDDVSWRRFVLARGPKIMDQLIDGVAAWQD